PGGGLVPLHSPLVGCIVLSAIIIGVAAAVRACAAVQVGIGAAGAAGLVFGPAAGELPGELAGQVVIDPAGEDRGEGGVAVITGSGPRPGQHRPRAGAGPGWPAAPGPPP